MAHVRVTPGSCPSPFGPSAKIADVLNRSRRFSQPLGQLSKTQIFLVTNIAPGYAWRTCALLRAPALRPSGHQQKSLMF